MYEYLDALRTFVSTWPLASLLTVMFIAFVS